MLGLLKRSVVLVVPPDRFGFFFERKQRRRLGKCLVFASKFLLKLFVLSLQLCEFFPLPLPVVIPYTMGELALLLNAKLGRQADLTVLPLEDWTRSEAWPRTTLPWIPPSPNIPTLDAAYAYLAAGVVQATNISEGRGTTKPFEYIGAPFLEAATLRAELRAAALPEIGRAHV